jgi:anoctamin-10/anoctamin-7
VWYISKVEWDNLLELIREYFGEKIGLYFAFLGFYSLWLAPVAVLAVVQQVSLWASSSSGETTLDELASDTTYAPAFSLFITIWAFAFLEFWKRKEAFLALRWGMLGFESGGEGIRPEFKEDEMVPYVVNNKVEYFYDEKKRKGFVILTNTVIAFLAIALVILTSSIYTLKSVGDTELSEEGLDRTIFSSVINAVKIILVNFLSPYICLWLTEQENHRTDTQFENNMIGKLFIFQFVNSFSSFYYYAFVVPASENRYNEDGAALCGQNTCLATLAVNLIAVFLMRIIVTQLVDLGYPWAVAYFRKKVSSSEVVYQEVSDLADTDTGGLPALRAQTEREYKLEPYTASYNAMEDYAAVTMQFGYMTLFISALPIATFFALMSNMLEVRSDGYKLLYLHRRTYSRGAETIGSWETILDILTKLACITNAGLVVFTINRFGHLSIEKRFWIFICFQWGLLTLQWIISHNIPSRPSDVKRQSQRTDYIVDKVIYEKKFDGSEDDYYDPSGFIHFRKNVKAASPSKSTLSPPPLPLVSQYFNSKKQGIVNASPSKRSGNKEERSHSQRSEHP